MIVRRSALGPLGLGVYNLFYWPYLITTSALFFGPAALIWLFSCWKQQKRLLHAYTSLWGAHYLAWAPFAGVRVEGREAALRNGPCVYVSNHQSMVDILAAFAVRLPYLWVSKLENFYTPFLGWTMVLNGYVPVKRGHLPSIRRMLRRCERRLAQGHSLFVFPEGTRSPDGTIRQFFRGAFWIAARNGVPIVPVVIEGTGGILPKGSFHIAPEPVVARILSPVHPKDFGGDDRALRDHVHALMTRELAALRGRALEEPGTLEYTS
jgi:1-acyl-sn-glycerol-3-phosphate acyltransferase